MPKYALLIDYEYCTGCESCVVACKMEHDMPIGKWGIRVHDDGPWQMNDEHEGGKSFNWNKIPVPTDMCDLCADRLAEGKKPTCVHHCLAFCMDFGTIAEMAAKLAEKPKQVLFAPCDCDIDLPGAEDVVFAPATKAAAGPRPRPKMAPKPPALRV